MFGVRKRKQYKKRNLTWLGLERFDESGCQESITLAAMLVLRRNDSDL